MPLILLSFAGCPMRGVAAWRQEDYNAYKFIRAVKGRRIGGTAWVPVPGGPPKRLTNANRDAALAWFADMAAGQVSQAVRRDTPTVLVPIPDAKRVVGAPPSRTRTMACELGSRCGLRVLDVLRWRSAMRRSEAAAADPQALSDNLVTTGAPVQADCILVDDLVTSGGDLQAAAARLRRHGGRPILAISAGRATDRLPADPFAVSVEQIPDFLPVDL